MLYDKSKRKGDVIVVAANAYQVEGYLIQKWVRNTVKNMTVLGKRRNRLDGLVYALILQIL